MNSAPLHVGRCRLSVDRVSEDVEHARKDPFADGHLQWPAGILDSHAASETLRRIQRDPADMPYVELHQHLDGDLRVLPCA